MREVKAQDWGTFCERVTENARGGTISIHKLESSGAKLEVVKDLSFDGMQFGKQNACNDQISVRCSGNTSLKHDVVEPIHIKLAESEGGVAFQSVIIEAEDGVTILTFHPIIKSAWLQGVAVQ
jgi:hypothetical protein